MKTIFRTSRSQWKPPKGFFSFHVVFAGSPTSCGCSLPKANSPGAAAPQTPSDGGMVWCDRTQVRLQPCCYCMVVEERAMGSHHPSFFPLRAFSFLKMHGSFKNFSVTSLPAFRSPACMAAAHPAYSAAGLSHYRDNARLFSSSNRKIR